MLPNLTANEARVIGCLLEKSVVTPDQYPLSLNGLTNACNQKSGRSPVMALEQGMVQRTVRDLETKHFMRTEENFKSRTEKYTQRFCNTRFSDYQFDSAQYAIVCLLLLRGPQTPGELRAHSGRLHTFADNGAVVVALDELIQTEGNPLAMQLPRTPGRKDCEYMHLFCGPIDVEAHAAESKPTVERVSVADLAQRVTDLEAEVRTLRQLLERQGD